MENKKELVSYSKALSICKDCEYSMTCNKSPYTILLDNLKDYDCDKVYIKKEI